MIETRKPTIDPAEKSRYVTAMFGRIARRYDLMNAIMTGAQDRRWRSLAVKMVRSDELSAEEWAAGRGLDIASGTGDLALAMAREAGLSGVAAIDLCPEMLLIAKDKISTKELSTSVSVAVADALRLPFADDSFVCATVGFGVRNFVDLPQAFAEMHRVLKPGARVACLELTRSPNGWFNRVFDLYFDHIVPLIGGIISGDMAAYSYLPNSVKAFPPADELAAIMRAAGFREVRYRRLGLSTVALHIGVK